MPQFDTMELPSDQTLQWLVRRYASLLARDGRPDVRRKLVLPTPEFFPDAFEGDQGSMNLLFWRLQEHACLTDYDLELRFVDDGGGAGGGGCSSGGECGCSDGGKHDHACGSGACACKNKASATLARVEALPDGAYRLDVRMSDARNATALTAAMATSLAHVYVLETGGFDGWAESEWMPSCELVAVTLGFGVLLSNASYMYSKACKGARIEQATALDVAELTLALAIFSQLGGHPHPQALGQLDPTQREAYAEARLWVESNAKLARRLQRDPGSVAADDHLVIEPARTWLARWLGIGTGKRRGAVTHPDDEELAALEKSLAERKRTGVGAGEKQQDARTLELRALVEESLRETRSSDEQ
jgi:hypothetical protein